ncbi:MAG: sigma-54 dependent transcriptional regulator [Desulfovibrionales bacterium]|nr:sigma-54 dependent transcriptional regulator [Desulfovibrionales bacterium]
MEQQRILVVDDDEDIQYALTRVAKRMGFAVDTAPTIAGTLEALRNEHHSAVFLDVNLPDGNGLSIIPEIMQQPSQPEVIVITGNGDPLSAEQAIQNGAWDYIEKRSSIQDITRILSKAVEYREERAASIQQRKSIPFDRTELIGESYAFSLVLQQVKQVAATDTNVLFTGETGTGKELFAHTIHVNSIRKKQPFIVVDCASLPENLAESILFGHVKGAFTGASQGTVGLVQQAHGGTLFLDEIGELPMALQKKFLRVLQERTVRPVGSNKEIHCDFRLISATNRDLAQMEKDGTFRSDLTYRIQAASIVLPPLRERKGDVPLLLDHYLRKNFAERNIAPKKYHPDFVALLEDYRWSGNLREFVHTIDYAVSSALHEETLFIKHLPPKLRAEVIRSRLAITEPEQDVPPQDGQAQPAPHSLPEHEELDAGAVPHHDSVADFLHSIEDAESFPTLHDYRNSIANDAEKQYLSLLLEKTHRTPQDVMRISGLSKSRLYALLNKHHLLDKK